MVLSSEQILKLLKTAANPAKLIRAKNIQKRLNFHAQIAEDATHVSSYYQDYLAWMKTIIGASDKQIQFEKLLTFPIATNDIIDEISDEYKKVFHAQNSLKQYQFRNPELKNDFEEYLEEIGDRDFWETKVFSSMLTAINSIVVVDMDSTPSTDVRPYALIVDIDQVHDLETSKRDAKIEYLIYKDTDITMIVLDDAYYRVYTKIENSDSYTLSVENPHDLGYCPASYMWSDCLDNKSPDIKQSPITSILAHLDWWLFLETGKKSLDIMASYPIYWTYKPKSCEFINEQGMPCTSGFHILNNKPQPCPACEKSKTFNGPGSMVLVPMPRSREDADLRDPIGVLPAETASLEYNVDNTERIKANIVKTATGKEVSSVLSKQQVNEDQVRSQFESQTNILSYLAENYEKINKWVIDTQAKLRYDQNYIGCSINYGSEFYLQTLDEVTKEYADGKKNGLPNYILLAKRTQIEELQGKDNPSEKDRINILKYLEPYPDQTPQELLSLGIKDMDFKGFVLKVNFATFITEFELNYGDITEWGSALEFKTKIERINQILKSYVDRIKKPEAIGQ